MPSPSSSASSGLVIVGAGAAGMAAGIFAAERARELGGGCSILLVDGARKPGAKILVSGGGRCNVTNQRVTAEDYNGGSRNVVRRVLRAFDEARTVEWMRSMGVELKLEPTGKYFPVTDQARTVLEALVLRLGELDVPVRAGHRVVGITPAAGGGFTLALASGGVMQAGRVLMATGGRALPKSGSDGESLGWLAAMGHAVVPPAPALVPMLLSGGVEGPGARFAELSGLAVEARLEARSPEGPVLAAETGSVLFTHFGLSGPAAMNLSRHLAVYRQQHPTGPMPGIAMGHPRFRNVAEAEAWLVERAQQEPRRLAATVLGELYPDRLARLLGEGLGQMAQLPREQRRRLAGLLAGLPLAYGGDRGFSFAETTAGGIALSEVEPRTFESRRVPGLHLCGEVLDVDGRIGGFNFQWAWASGYLAGRGAVEGLLSPTPPA